MLRAEDFTDPGDVFSSGGAKEVGAGSNVISSSDFSHAQWCLSEWSYHFFKNLRLDGPPRRQSLLLLQSRKNCSRQCASPQSQV